MNNLQKIHELYHSKTKKQLRVIDNNNFTYKILIGILNTYVKPQMEILDIGCGAGSLSFYLANKTNKVHGIDISKKAITECINSKRYLKLQNVTFEVLNFPKNKPKGKYDLVMFTEVIEQIVDPVIALKKIHELLNSNGLLFLTTPSNNAPLFKWGLTKKFDEKVGHVQRFSLQDLMSLLKSNDFDIKAIYFSEGVLRNFLYVNPIAGKFIRFIKGPIVPIFTKIDNLTIKLFGESQFIIVAQKV